MMTQERAAHQRPARVRMWTMARLFAGERAMTLQVSTKRGVRADALFAAVPPPAQVLLSIVSVQLGAVLTKGLFGTIGPAGAVFLRSACGALLLLLLWQPRVRGHARGDRATVLAFGLVLAGMSLAFYAALERLPLGAAVTLSFAGPLGVALLGSRRPLDLLWGGWRWPGSSCSARSAGGSTSAVWHWRCWRAASGGPTSRSACGPDARSRAGVALRWRWARRRR
jgi:hypothetical protein